MQLSFPRPPDPDATKDTPLSALVASLFGLPDLASLKAAYDQLQPSIYVENEVITIFSNLNFEDALHSCRSRDGAYRFVQEGQCIWAALGYSKLGRDQTADNTSFDEQTNSTAGGAQWALSETWHAGAAFGVDRTSLATDSGATSDGDIFQGGAVLKGEWGNTTVATSLTGGYARFDTGRIAAFPGIAEEAEGTQKIGFAAANVRLAHAFAGPAWYVRPSIDAGIMHYVVDSFHESGSSL